MVSIGSTRKEPSSRRPRLRLVAAPLLIAGTALGTLAGGAAPAGAASTFLGSLSTITQVASTVPANGDVNPYGVAVVQRSVGHLHRGNVLVSNFNNSSNFQGTGTTIVQVSPAGAVSVFATLPLDSGLTTALSILPNGFVAVGSLPTVDGTSATATAGAVYILNRWGHLVETLQGGDINGPWDMTSVSSGPIAELFFTNVLNGTVAESPNNVNGGTVVRLTLRSTGARPQVLANTIIANGFPEHTDPAALVVGPTGVGLAANGTLYVADTVDNSIQAIPDATSRTTSAGTGLTITSGLPLNSPLGLAIAPNGDIITMNAADGNAVETTPAGTQVATATLESMGGGGGALFGLAIAPGGRSLYFVDDDLNTLMLFS